MLIDYQTWDVSGQLSDQYYVYQLWFINIMFIISRFVMVCWSLLLFSFSLLPGPSSHLAPPPDSSQLGGDGYNKRHGKSAMVTTISSCILVNRNILNIVDTVYSIKQCIYMYLYTVNVRNVINIVDVYFRPWSNKKTLSHTADMCTMCPIWSPLVFNSSRHIGR